MQLAIELCIYEKHIRANALKTVHKLCTVRVATREAAECFFALDDNGLKLIFR